MTSFLSDLARTLYQKHGDNIHKLTIVFPSRRARYYFSRALAQLIKQPTWQPRYVGIDEFIHGHTSLRVADSYRLIIELYRAFADVKKTNETFDQFYFWGEALLNDFDAIDKYMVEPDQLFRNLAAEKELTDDLSFLTDEQREIIASFWKAFEAKESQQNEYQSQFLSVWEALLPIYRQFNQRLREQGLAYSGMIYRDMAQNLKNGEELFADAEHTVFAGFNALNRCEQVLFDYMRKRNAGFYYDYDSYYVKSKEQEAGLFLRKNLEMFPETKNLNPKNLFSKGKKEIAIVATPSDSIQAKYAAQLAMDIVARGGKAEQTAIVFTDETLLTPVLSAISYSEDGSTSPQIETVNVTMGYPLKITPVYSLIEHVLSLYRTLKSNDDGVFFYHKDVSAIVSHQLLKGLGIEEFENVRKQIKEENQIFLSQSRLCQLPLIGPIFSIEASSNKQKEGKVSYQRLSAALIEILEQLLDRENAKSDEQSEHYVEFINTTLVALRKLHTALVREAMDISLQVYISLVRKALSGIRIPFEGFPVAGLQLMGILETRNLDFENVIILSLNDDRFPAVAQQPSFVPYNIKRAFGMPTYEQQEAMYAYYFYRLLQRAGNIHLLYNTKADERSTGEMSRFLQQLKFESGLDITEQTIGYSLGFKTSPAITIEKSPEVMEILNQYVDGSRRRGLSPSAISSYLTCRLKFYFNYIADVKEQEDVEEDISNQIFGKILHEAMDVIYQQLGKESISANELEALLNDQQRIEKVIDDAFAKEFIKSEEGKSLLKMNGKFLLVKRVVTTYIRGILKYDLELIRQGSSLAMVSLEEPMAAMHPFTVDGQSRSIFLKGRLDRVDRLNGVTRIVDYKTGAYKGKNEFAGFEKMFVGKDTSKYSGSMQTFLYSLMYDISKKGEVKNIKPALYFVRGIQTNDFEPSLALKEGRNGATIIENFFDFKDEYVSFLDNALAELFGSSQPFDQTGDPAQMCQKYCPYNVICKR